MKITLRVFFPMAAFGCLVLSQSLYAEDACERYQTEGYVHPVYTVKPFDLVSRKVSGHRRTLQWTNSFSLEERLAAADALFSADVLAGTVPQDDQIHLYRACQLFEQQADFSRLGQCLDALDHSLNAFGDVPEAVSLFGGKGNVPPTPYFYLGEFPLAASVKLLRANVALLHNRPEEALRLVEQADRCLLSESRTGLLDPSRTLDNLLKADGSPSSSSTKRLRRFAQVLARIYLQLDETSKANKMMDVLGALSAEVYFDRRSFEHLNKADTGESKRAEVLAALYMSSGRSQEALSMIENYRAGGRRFYAFMESLQVLGIPLLFGGIKTLINPYSLSFQFQRGHLQAEVGRFAEAKSDLDELIGNEEFQLVGSLYWAALYDRGRIAEKENQPDEAIDFYLKSVSEIEHQRSTINTEGDRIGFFGDKQAVYQALVRLLIQQNRSEDAFLFSERGKARALVDMLANKQDFALPEGSNDKVRELLARQHASDNLLTMGSSLPDDIKQSITALVEAAKDKNPVASLVASSRNIRASIAQDIAALSPELASLVSVSKISLKDIRDNLPADEVLLSYFYDKQHLYAFVMTKDTVKAISLEREGLEKDIETFRKALHDQEKNGAGESLYSRLISPVEAELTTGKVLIAPHGALHYLPFAALSDGSKYLVDRYQLNFIPSASTLKYVGKRPAESKAGTMLALGNPDLGNKRYDLAFAETEAKSVGAIFPQSVVLLRAEASKKNVKEYGAGFKYLHFATHGEFYPDKPMGSALMLAGQSATDEKDRLTVSELYSMRLNADLVTLSACQTGLGKISNGDDVVGLVRGFLYAGANSVISTLWEIDDEATSKLMTAFYQKLKAGKPKAAALREAQIELRTAYPHPYFWAAFQMTGGHAL
ncbi:CHAT domain-containing protein [Propionivibrio dicarboxylicus]|uniref:CHAT domain-containing protein n=1 Tax=Propionivibrio dicarboxylicus TaxID=83767 RepID=A0A1G8FW50_9RHOO|nr:CHAT domain-containing protein [Propionivibrio dicarboxylicus]SDH86372.1 CHAT domain-containing protein [Propionivibrio dicarboxylicus]